MTPPPTGACGRKSTASTFPVGASVNEAHAATAKAGCDRVSDRQCKRKRDRRVDGRTSASQNLVGFDGGPRFVGADAADEPFDDLARFDDP